MDKKDASLDPPSSENQEAGLGPSVSPEALGQKLEQGLAYYKVGKYGKAIACFRELVKNFKFIDEGKQHILAKALQSTTSGCLKKEKYRKAIKSAKLTLRTLHYLARKTPEAEAELKPAQEKLLAAVEGYLSFTIEQHKRLLTQELNRGNLPKANLMQMCREGLTLLNKPLIVTDTGSNKIKIKIKNTRTNLAFNETLKDLVEWALKAEVSAYEAKNYLEAFIYCKIATGPLSTALHQGLLEITEKEKDKLLELAKTQAALESSLRSEAAQALESGLAAYLKAGTPNSKDFAEQLENAKKDFKEAAKKYNYLENHEKMFEAQQHLKNTLSLQEKLGKSLQSGWNHASFLAQNLSGGSKKLKPHLPREENKEQTVSSESEQKKQNPK